MQGVGDVGGSPWLRGMERKSGGGNICVLRFSAKLRLSSLYFCRWTGPWLRSFQWAGLVSFFFSSLQEFPPLLLPILRLLKQLKSHLLKDPITWRRQKSSSSTKEKDVWKILPVYCCCCWETSLKQLFGQQGITKETLSDAVHLSNFQTLPCNFSKLLASRDWNKTFSFDHEKLNPNLLLLTFLLLLLFEKKKNIPRLWARNWSKDKFMVIVNTRGRKWVGLNSLKRFFYYCFSFLSTFYFWASQ